MWFLSLNSFIMYNIYGVSYVDLLHLSNSGNLIMVNDVLMHSWIQFSRDLLRIFTSMCIKESVLQFFPSLCLYLVWVAGYLGFIEAWQHAVRFSFMKEIDEQSVLVILKGSGRTQQWFHLACRVLIWKIFITSSIL